MDTDSFFACPYKSYPPSSYWSKAVGALPYSDIDPVIATPFLITKSTKIATAGSCFAQHISRYLATSGYTYFVTEDVMPRIIPEFVRKRFNYGVFPARFGNIYTARQLLQLFLRVYDEFQPVEDVWAGAAGLTDPFRPLIQPGGFENPEVFRRDRRQHFAAVRRLFEQSDVFVFTLGLTEAWRSKADGAVFPVCPGCGVGSFDPEKYEFHNFDYEEIIQDLRIFMNRVSAINPNIRFLFTVSPVPLVATATGDHVLAATTYSKSVLRAVAGKLAAENSRVAYFPSYEIIMTPANEGRYFGADRRSVTEAGVSAVMRVFFRHFTRPESGSAAVPAVAAVPAGQSAATASPGFSPAEVAAALVCEEEILEAAAR